MAKLGVNIDHVATVRNARGGDVPDPVRAAKLAEEAGADIFVVQSTVATIDHISTQYETLDVEAFIDSIAR